MRSNNRHQALVQALEQRKRKSDGCLLIYRSLSSACGRASSSPALALAQRCLGGARVDLAVVTVIPLFITLLLVDVSILENNSYFGPLHL